MENSLEKPTRLDHRGARKNLRLGNPAWLVPITLTITLVVWEIAVRIWNMPAFILPSPALVAGRFWQVLLDGSLLFHTFYTLMEVMAGMTIGVLAAATSGYFLSKSQTVERILAPYIVASQSVPVVAIAPLLIIWFGSGLTSKVLICALIVFFPVLINTMVGVRSVPEDLRDLMRSFRATPWQTFVHLEVPAALPVFLGGLRVGATLAVIGAVVGEFVGADRGLGYLINRARGQYDTSLVFVTILTLVLMALTLYGTVAFVETRLLSWQEPSRGTVVKE
jgi:NitT/TauT family transport system permease protein